MVWRMFTVISEFILQTLKQISLTSIQWRFLSPLTTPQYHLETVLHQAPLLGRIVIRWKTTFLKKILIGINQAMEGLSQFNLISTLRGLKTFNSWTRKSWLIWPKWTESRGMILINLTLTGKWVQIQSVKWLNSLYLKFTSKGSGLNKAYLRLTSMAMKSGSHQMAPHSIRIDSNFLTNIAGAKMANKQFMCKIKALQTWLMLMKRLMRRASSKMSKIGHLKTPRVMMLYSNPAKIVTGFWQIFSKNKAWRIIMV